MIVLLDFILFELRCDADVISAEPRFRIYASYLLTLYSQQISINNMERIIYSLEDVSNKLANIEGKINNIESKISDIEAKLDSNIKRLDENISKLAASTSERFERTDQQILNINERFKTLEMNYTKDRILADLYNKRNNLIIHGLPESTINEDKDRNESLVQVQKFLTEHLKIDKQIFIFDAHRMKSNNTIKKSARWSARPLIFRLSNIFDKDLIFKNLANLKPTNPSTRQSIYITPHLPASMVKQRTALLPKFKEAKRDRSATRWQIDYSSATYCLFINGNKINAD